MSSKPLSRFINEFQIGALRNATQWSMGITTGYDDVDQALLVIDMYADGFEVPTRTQKTAEVFFKGKKFLVPTVVEFQQEHTFNILCDANGNSHKTMLKWINYHTDSAISQGSFFGGEKRIPANSFIRFNMLAQDMKTVLQTYRLCGVIPGEVGPIKMSHKDNPEICTFEFKCNSQYWEVESSEGDFQEQK